MADEKRVNVVVDGDASGLADEIERVAKRGSEAFKELGFDDVLDEAANKFEKRIEQFEYVLSELKKDRDEAKGVFDERMTKATNQAGRNRVETERDEYMKQNTRATEGLRKAMDDYLKRLQQGRVDEQGRPIRPKTKEEEAAEAGRLPQQEPQQATEDRYDRMGKMLGRGFMMMLTGNFAGGLSNIFKGIGGGGSDSEGGGGMFGGMKGMLFAAAAALGVKAWKMGQEDIRADNRLRAMGAGKDYYADDYDYGNFSSLGINRTDAKKMILEQLRSTVGMGMRDTDTSNNSGGIKQEAFTATVRRNQIEAAYGISGVEQQRLDQFYRQNKQDAATVVAEMLTRNKDQITSAGGTVLGSLANEKLGQIVRLMEFQKEHAINTDSRLAMSILSGGGKIGGQFADDRAGENLGGFMGGLSNPRGNLMKALMYSILSKRNGGDPSATLEEMEGMGSNPATFQYTMSKMGGMFKDSPFTRMLFSGSDFLGNQTGLFKNQTAANQFFRGGGFQTMGQSVAEGMGMEQALNQGVDGVFKAIQKRAENLTLNTDAMQVKAQNVMIYGGRTAGAMVGNDDNVTENKPNQ